MLLLGSSLFPVCLLMFWCIEMFLFIYAAWVPANIVTESSHRFQKFIRNSGTQTFCKTICPNVVVDYSILIYTHHRVLMKSVELMAARHGHSWLRHLCDWH
jgi:uncharacterized membrane protein